MIKKTIHDLLYKENEFDCYGLNIKNVEDLLYKEKSLASYIKTTHLLPLQIIKKKKKKYLQRQEDIKGRKGV
jgi:hypothetical protein